jgi:hydrogenase nickel incorporation protein HypA/HybF
MHEFGLCDGIVEAVQKRANGRPVARVCVQVGVLHRVGVDAFRHAFSHAAEGAEAENAALDLVIMPVRAVCRTCQAETDGDDIVMVCPKCNGVDLDLTGGDELVLESVEYEGPETTSWLGKE